MLCLYFNAPPDNETIESNLARALNGYATGYLTTRTSSKGALVVSKVTGKIQGATVVAFAHMAVKQPQARLTLNDGCRLLVGYQCDDSDMLPADSWGQVINNEDFFRLVPSLLKNLLVEAALHRRGDRDFLQRFKLARNWLTISIDDAPLTSLMSSTQWTPNRCVLVPPDQLGSDDICHQMPKASRWLSDPCVLQTVRLQAGVRLPPNLIMPILLHDEKFRLLGLLQDEHIDPRLVLRGRVKETTFQVFGSLSDVMMWRGDTEATADTPEEDTWKYNAMWVCQFQRDAVQLSWSHGALHLITSAPRTTYGRWRIMLGTAADFRGDAIGVIIRFVGSTVFAVNGLRREREKVRPALEQLFSPGEVVRRPNVLEGAPPLAFSGLDADMPNTPFLERSGLRFNQEQDAVLKAILHSEGNLHLVEGLAGCGKTTVALGLLLRWLAKFQDNEAMPPEEQAELRAGLAVVCLPSRNVRQDFVHTASALTAKADVGILWVGRPPDSDATAGTGTDHLILEAQEAVKEDLDILKTNIAIATAAAKALPAEGLAPAILAEDMWDPCSLSVGAAVDLGPFLDVKALLCQCLHNASRFFIKLWEQVAQLLKTKQLLVLTTDMALKLVSWEGDSVVKALLRMKNVELAIVDEVQRQPVISLATICAWAECVVCFGDPSQRVKWQHQTTWQIDPENVNVWQAGIERVGAPRVLWADEVMKGLPATGPAAVVHQVHQSKRRGDPLVRYLRHAYPKLCGDMQPAEHGTSLTINIIDVVNHTWFTVRDTMTKSKATAAGAPSPPGLTLDLDAPHVSDHIGWTVVFNLTYFTALAVTIIQNLRDYERERGVITEEPAPHIIVCFVLRRFLGPFEAVLRQIILSDADLTGLHSDPRLVQMLVDVRMSGNLTGPTYDIAHVVLHRRLRGENAGLAGRQKDSSLQYIMLSRARKTCHFWQERFQAEKPLGLAQTLGLPVREFGDLLSDWEEGLAHSADNVRHAVQLAIVAKPELLRHAIGITPTSGKCLKDVLGEGPGGTPGAALRDLAAMTTPYLRELAHDIAGYTPATPLDYGVDSTPQCSFRIDSASLHKLAPTLLSAVSVTVLSGRAWLVGIPTIQCDFVGEGTLGYGTEVEVINGENIGKSNPVLRSFLNLVHKIYVRILADTTEGLDLATQSRNHKASVDTDDGLVFFHKACASDREAVTLVDKETAVAEYPRYPKRWAAYLYIGGGLDNQPEVVTSLVCKVRDDVNLVASVLIAARAVSNFARRDFHGVNLDKQSLLLHYDDTKEDLTSAASAEVVVEKVADACTVLQISPTGHFDATELVDSLIQDTARCNPMPLVEMKGKGEGKGKGNVNKGNLKGKGEHIVIDGAAAAGKGEKGKQAGKASPKGKGEKGFFQKGTGDSAGSSDPSSKRASASDGTPAKRQCQAPGPPDTGGPSPPGGPPDSVPNAGALAGSPFGRLGLDLGGVLLPRCRAAGGVTGPGAKDWMINRGGQDGAWDALRELAGRIGATNMYIISRVTSDRMRRMLTDVCGALGVFEIIPYCNLYYCRDFSGRDSKGPLCARLRINCFVDDHPKNLDTIQRDVPDCHTLLFESNWGDLTRTILRVMNVTWQ